MNQSKLLLHQLILQYFSISELKELFFKLDVDYEKFGTKDKTEIVMGLITYLERRDGIGGLVRLVCIERPQIASKFISKDRENLHRSVDVDYQSKHFKQNEFSTKVSLRLIIFIAIVVFVSVFFNILPNINRINEVEVTPESGVMRVMSEESELRKLLNNNGRSEVYEDIEKIIIAEHYIFDHEVEFDERLGLMVAGRVYAGVDFTKIGFLDLRIINNDTIWMRLPQAEIFYDKPVLFHNDNTYVFFLDSGRKMGPDSYLIDAYLMDEMYRGAEDALVDAALGTDLLMQANVKARQQTQDILSAYDYNNVVFLPDSE